MRNALFACLSLLPLGLSGCFNQATVNAAPESTICITKVQWPDLIASVKSFGNAHGMTFFGGIEDFDKPADATSVLNIRLAQDQDANTEGGLDLWITGMSFEPTRVHYSAMVRQEPTEHQQALAHALLIDLTKLGPLAVKHDSESICPNSPHPLRNGQSTTRPAHSAHHTNTG
jgi:hypothetical protein